MALGALVHMMLICSVGSTLESSPLEFLLDAEYSFRYFSGHWKATGHFFGKFIIWKILVHRARGGSPKKGTSKEYKDCCSFFSIKSWVLKLGFLAFSQGPGLIRFFSLKLPEKIGFSNSGFWLFPGVLEGLGSSGRLVGTMFTYPGTYKCPVSRVMAQNPPGEFFTEYGTLDETV